MSANHEGAGAEDWQAPGAIERFSAAWSRATDLWGAPLELLPTRLTAMCKDALPVDGAGLSILSGAHRVPLGSTDESATRAEKLQFVIGEGPCLETLSTRNPVQVDCHAMRDRWPGFYSELAAHTPFRSIIAVPLEISAGISGALDLYFCDPKGAAIFDIIDAVAVANQIGSLLRFASGSSSGQQAAGPWNPSWMHGPSAEQRIRVWIASGVLMAHATITGPDALALLRAYAYAEQRPLDDIADALIDGSLAVQEFQL